MSYPWEQLPISIAKHEPARPSADVVELIQADLRFIVSHTGVLVRSTCEPLNKLVFNTQRGQIIPRGECKFQDGSTFELQDIGMPQPGAPTITIDELLQRIWDLARELGLTL